MMANWHKNCNCEGSMCPACVGNIPTYQKISLDFAGSIVPTHH